MLTLHQVKWISKKKVRNKNKIIKGWKKRLEVKKQKLRDEIISINVVFLLLEVKAKEK